MNHLISAIVVTAIVFTSSLTFSRDTDSLTIQSYIDRREVQLKASEYKNARSFMTGDLDQDGIDDLAILYTLEGIGGGGNNYSFFLAAFIQTEEGLKFASDILVGGKSSRTLSFKSIENGVVTFDTRFNTVREDGTWDASCCPSGEGQAFYVLFYGELRELNVAEAAPIDWKKVRKVMKAK